MIMDRKGNDSEKVYIVTFTGKKFYLLEPRLKDIDIIDIAHALSLQCRWTGHCKFHYSIAQHSYYCSFIGPINEAFDRLMHDAAEAYIADLNRPLKHFTEMGKYYREIEKQLQYAIADRFGFSRIKPASVKLADNSMLYAEKKQIVRYTFEEVENRESYKDDIEILILKWSPKFAEKMFLDRFNQLYKGKIN